VHCAYSAFLLKMCTAHFAGAVPVTRTGPGRRAEKLESGFRKLGISRISMDMPRIYHVYTSNDIPCISMDITCMYCMDIQGSHGPARHGSTKYMIQILRSSEEAESDQEE
jgi:hypothetical protein